MKTKKSRERKDKLDKQSNMHKKTTNRTSRATCTKNPYKTKYKTRPIATFQTVTKYKYILWIFT
jgi:hypothetical protein